MKLPSLSGPIGKLLVLLFCTIPLAAWSQAAPVAAPSAPAVSRPCGGDPEDYIVGLHEEFDGPLNTNIWLDRFFFAPPPDPPYGYEVSNGSLKMWIERDPTDPQQQFRSKAIFSDPKAPVGAILQRTGYVQRYGCFEVEAKLPFGKGPFSAFWLAAIGERPIPEIDIMESYNRDQYADFEAHPISYEVTTHTACSPEQDQECNTERQSKASGTQQIYTNADLSAGFHRYAAKWEPNQITFYYDGNVRHIIPVSYPDPMFVAVGIFPDGLSKPDDTTPTRRGNRLDAGAAYEVNYIRTWCFKVYGCR